MAAINFYDYVRQLMNDIEQTYSSSKQIKHELDIDNIAFNLEKAMPLGLIINELATNSYKYAFNESDIRLISIKLKQLQSEDKYELIYADNGIGLPDDFTVEETKSLGMRLIKILSKQLNGKINFTTVCGFKFKLSFYKQ